MGAQADRPGDAGEGFAPHQLGVPPGHLALALVPVGGEEKLGDDQPEHPVAEEFEAFVVIGAGVPAVAVAGVGQRAFEQFAAFEDVPQGRAKRVFGGLGAGHYLTELKTREKRM